MTPPWEIGQRVRCWYPDREPYEATVLAVEPRMYGRALQNGWIVTVTTRPPCPCCGHRETDARDVTLGHEWLEEVER